MTKRLILMALAGLILLPILAHAEVTDDEWKKVNKEFSGLWAKKEKVEAVGVLGGCDDLRAVKQLWKILTKYKETSDVNDAVGTALSGMTDEKGIDYIVKNVTAKMSPEKRLIVCDAVSSIENPKVVSALKKLLEDKSPLTKTAAADALGIMKEKSAIPALIKALDDKDWQVRAAVIVAFVRLEDKQCIQPLIDRLDKEKGRLVGDIVKALKALTGADKDTSFAWNGWWKLNKDKPLEGGGINAWKDQSQTGQLTPPKDGDSGGDGGSVTYYGIKIHSRKLVFVIDMSGSMKDKWEGEKPKKPKQTVEITSSKKGGGDGLTRKATLDWDKVRTKWDLAREHLIFTLKLLDKKTNFTIIYYHSQVKVWKTKLVPATNGNKTSAIAMLRKIKPNRSTNIYGALERCFKLASGSKQAVELSNYKSGGDTVFFLTDGWPTSGKVYWKRPNTTKINKDWLEQMMAAVNKWNRLRKVKVHCIGIGNHCKRLMSAIAEEYGGDYVVPGEDD